MRALSFLRKLHLAPYPPSEELANIFFKSYEFSQSRNIGAGIGVPIQRWIYDWVYLYTGRIDLSPPKLDEVKLLSQQLINNFLFTKAPAHTKKGITQYKVSQSINEEFESFVGSSTPGKLKLLF